MALLGLQLALPQYSPDEHVERGDSQVLLAREYYKK